MFFGAVPGFRDLHLTPELVLEHADEILDTEEMVVVGDGSDDLRYLADDASTR